MRIRSIKPEFFDSPSTAKASPWGRLLYIAMWCMADDWGVGSANPKELAAGAFPNDDQWTAQELPSLCKEVADAFDVEFYTHRGRRYYQIPSWDEHQVTQRRAKRRFPTADDPESVPDLLVPEGPCVRKEVPSHRKENASTEQGNRGTGEQGSRGAGEQTLLVNAAASTDEDTPTGFNEWWQVWPKRTRKAQAETEYRKAIKTIPARQLLEATRQWVAAFEAAGKSRQYMPDPNRWLRDKRWEDDLAAFTPATDTQSRTSQRLDGAMRLVQRLEQEDPWNSPRQLGS